MPLPLLAWGAITLIGGTLGTSVLVNQTGKTAKVISDELEDTATKTATSAIVLGAAALGLYVAYKGAKGKK